MAPSDRRSTISGRADKHATLWQQSVHTPRAGQRARCRFVEGGAIEPGKFAHVMKAVGPGAGRDRDGVGAFHQWRSGRPKLLEAQIAMQTHAADACDGRAQRPDRYAALFSEVGAVDRRSRMIGDILVDR